MIAPLAQGRCCTFLCHLTYMVWAPRPAQRPAFAHRGLFAAPHVVPHSGLSRRMVAHALDCAHNLAAAALCVGDHWLASRYELDVLVCEHAVDA